MMYVSSHVVLSVVMLSAGKVQYILKKQTTRKKVITVGARFALDTVYEPPHTSTSTPGPLFTPLHLEALFFPNQAS